VLSIAVARSARFLDPRSGTPMLAGALSANRIADLDRASRFALAL
jgi:hypothetical protein